MASSHPTSQQPPCAGGCRTTRLVGGLLLLMVLGATLEPETNGRWSHSAREHAAQELAGARRAGERVAKALWSFVGRHAIEAPAVATEARLNPTPRAQRTVEPVVMHAVGVELGVWLLDLPPPMRA